MYVYDVRTYACMYLFNMPEIISGENTDVHTYILINRLVQMVKDSNSRFPRLKQKMYVSSEVIAGVCLISNHICAINSFDKEQTQEVTSVQMDAQTEPVLL